jgi:hypothetical protein
VNTEEARVKTSAGRGLRATSAQWTPPVTETYRDIRLKYFATWVSRRKR